MARWFLIYLNPNTIFENVQKKCVIVLTSKTLKSSIKAETDKKRHTETTEAGPLLTATSRAKISSNVNTFAYISFAFKNCQKIIADLERSLTI